MSVPRTGVGVLDRSAAILDAVERGVRTIRDISRETGLHRATTHRLVKALEAQGFLALVGGLGYRLGPHLLRLAASAARDQPLRDLAHPALERLATVTGESAQLYVREGDRRVCVDVVESTSELRTIVEVGADLPLTAGSAGKIFLASTNDTDRERLLRGYRPLTERAPNRDHLLRQLAAARRQGWIQSAGEREPGVGSVSAPVMGPHGGLLAVVSVSGPVGRVARISAKRYAPAVLAAAQEIESALGVSSR